MMRACNKWLKWAFIEAAWLAVDCGANQETICEKPRPSLSSVELGYERVGYQAAKLLDELMHDDGDSSGGDPPHIFVPPEGLIVREFTDFYSVQDRLVAAALEFISANCHLSIGQSEVADAVSVETRTLQNRFRKVMHRPIASVIRRARIDRAKRELTQSDLPLAVIARKVGFSGPERMNEVFRREMRMSPSQYRRERRPDAVGG